MGDRAPIFITDPAMAAHRATLTKKLKELRPRVDEMAREIIDHSPRQGPPEGIIEWVEERFTTKELALGTFVAILEASIAKIDDDHGTELAIADITAHGWPS